MEIGYYQLFNNFYTKVDYFYFGKDIKTNLLIMIHKELVAIEGKHYASLYSLFIKCYYKTRYDENTKL